MIGIIVDDAVIVGENIHLEYERGRTGTDAAITGAYLVAKPVFFAVITTMIAFCLIMIGKMAWRLFIS